MRIEIETGPVWAVSALPGEVVGKHWYWAGSGEAQVRVDRKWTVKEPVFLELEIDGAGLEEMARRAILNKSKRCKDGPFVVRVRGGKKGAVLDYEETTAKATR